jgi:chromosome segregation protein
MYLKRLEMENFKSFGRKTVIEFKKGFTGVSGPNGSGKSNISDAILFVLGPRSSKVLRAQKLTDLIFNGGKEKNPADYCKVSLVFDNKDREIPIESDEVKFTRILKKESEDDYVSYFYINEEKARLQDFTNLLSKAKIFADGYNIVQQGDITRIVEMSPIERRKILEEISGITKYDEEIAQAERKKIEVDENISKLDVLIKEIKDRLEILERDRNVALRYIELKKQLEYARAALAYRKIKDLKAQIDGDENEIITIQNEINSIKNEYESLLKEEEEKKKRISTIDENLKKGGGEEQIKIKNRIDELKLQNGKLNIRREDLQTRLDEIKEEKKILESKKKELRDKKSELEKEYNKNLGIKNELQSEIERIKKELENHENKMSTSSNDMIILQKEYVKKQNELNEILNDLSIKQSYLSSLREKYSSIIDKIASLEEDEKKYELEIKDAEWRLDDIKDREKNRKSKYEELSKEYYTLKNRENELRKRMKELDERIMTLSRIYEKNKAKFEAMHGQDAINEILELRDKNIIKGIIGTAKEIIDVPKDLDLAIYVAGGNRLDSIIVEDDSVAAQCIEHLKKTGRGIATFLPLNKLTIGRPRGKALLALNDPDTVGLILDLIKYDKKYESALWYVFSDTIIVKNLDAARRLMGGVRIVTKDGQLIEASGAMIGGYVQKPEKVSIQSDIEKISKELRELTIERENVDNELKEVNQRIDKITREIQELSSEKIEDSSIYEKIIKENAEKLNRIKNELSSIYKQKGELETKISEYENELKSIEEKKVYMQKDIENIRIKIDSFAPMDIQKKVKELKNELENINSKYSAIIILIKDEENSIKSIDENLKSIEERIKMLNEELTSKHEEINKITREVESIHLEINKLNEINMIYEENAKKLWNEREKLVNDIQKIENEISLKNNDLSRKNDFIITLKTRIASNKKELENALNEYNMMNINVTEPVPGVNELKKTIDYSEETMKSLEPVNMKSIEEYESEKSRLDGILKDYENLQNEKKNLISLMEELNVKKKEGFLDVYRSIRENFINIYSRITDGGEAIMYLENEDDPFAGGLVIKAKPKGKKMIRLEALSGGEKSLTALTFILAIQQYTPSPFYLFDESDMFLDAFNAENVARILKENSSRAQFIVVSLRRVVLKYADHVIGVTLSPDGISKIYEETYQEEVVEYGQ